ncbi:MAG: flagellar biosynthesis protein FliQ [bacterium]
MGTDFAVDVIYNGVFLTLMLSMPIVGLALLIGFLISLFQAVTQIQEQTLTFVPKVIVVLLVFAFTSPWMISLLVDFTTSLWGNIPNLVK